MHDPLTRQPFRSLVPNGPAAFQYGSKLEQPVSSLPTRIASSHRPATIHRDPNLSQPCSRWLASWIVAPVGDPLIAGNSDLRLQMLSHISYGPEPKPAKLMIPMRARNSDCVLLCASQASYGRKPKPSKCMIPSLAARLDRLLLWASQTP